MPKGVYAAASAMVTETRLLEATTRNIAHAQTPGYRREGSLRVGFAEVLANQGAKGAESGIAGAGGSGVLPNGSYFSFADGPRDPTGNPYDLALEGDGFFAVQDSAGKTWLTRAGNFQIDAQNHLTTHEGQVLLGQGGPIAIPDEAKQVRVDGSGLVTVDGKDLDRVRVATVANPQQMLPSNGIYFDPAGQSLVDGKAKVQQGALERGNVNPVDELVQLVSLQRRYDAAQKALLEQSRAGDGYSDILKS